MATNNGLIAINKGPKQNRSKVMNIVGKYHF